MTTNLNYSEIMVRYGELSTKGKNRMRIIGRLAKNIREVLTEFPTISVKSERDWVFFFLKGAEYGRLAEKLVKVFGIQNFSPANKVDKNMPAIEAAVATLMKNVYQEGMTFKITAKRSDHDFELDSTELNRELGHTVIMAVPHAKVQMKKPDIDLRVEIRPDFAYLSYEMIKGAGGLPVGTAGKGMLMLSGGIDSPVAGYLALKRGVEIEAVHFASPPYTSPGALQKAKDLASKLTVFGGDIQFIEVPFTEIQEEIKEKVPMPYLMTVTRRFMMRVVDEIRARRHGQVIINGESLGQVASQTLGSMTAINAVTTTPVIRPVVTMDKLEIIELAEKIDTFNISIQPFEDCCTIFALPQPKTKPKLENAEKFEARMDINNLVKRAVDEKIDSQITGEMQVDALEAAIQDLL